MVCVIFLKLLVSTVKIRAHKEEAIGLIQAAVLPDRCDGVKELITLAF